MAIYSKFGTEVEVIGGNVETGEVEYRLNDHVIYSYIDELKADGGIQEIDAAIEDRQ